MTAATATTTVTPAAYIACLFCYNSGHLVGDWFDAIDADQVTLADVHRGTDRLTRQCEELWVMDHEGLPVSSEMSPMDAAVWAREITSVADFLQPAYFAWIKGSGYSDPDEPCIDDFEERYCGEWDDFAEYAHQLVDEIGLLIDVPEEVSRYFNWDSWTRDLAHDYSTEPAPDGGVFVFRSF